MATAAKTVAEVCREAKDASHLLARASREEKDACLRDLADRIDASATALLEANRADVEAGREEGLNEALIDRLTLTEARIAEMAKGVREIADLEDPVGEVVEGWTLENGLEVAKKRVPIGVVAVVYEARPNVTIDAAALCLKSGNAAVLRGSSSAESSNAFLAGVIADALAAAELPTASVSLLSGGGHEQLSELATQEGLVDLIIPRGGEGLKNALKSVAKVPVMYAAAGQLPCLRASGRRPGDGRAGGVQREGAEAGCLQRGRDAAGASRCGCGAAAHAARQAQRGRSRTGRRREDARMRRRRWRSGRPRRRIGTPSTTA